MNICGAQMQLWPAGHSLLCVRDEAGVPLANLLVGLSNQQAISSSGKGSKRPHVVRTHYMMSPSYEALTKQHCLKLCKYYQLC